MKKIKIIQLFEAYGDIYQPYIPPVMESLKKKDDFDMQIDVFKEHAKADDVNVIPGYYKRKIKEKALSLSNKGAVKLNYIENKYLKNKVDIVHLQHSYLHKKVKRLLAIPKAQRPKIVITLRGADTYMKPWIDKNWVNFYETYGQYVDAFITMSEHQKNYMQKWGIPLDKIHVIPISYGNAFKTSERLPNTESIQLISAFRMCWEKNIEGNLRVVKLLKDKGLRVNYSIYGNGPDAYQVPYLIDKYQLSEAVQYYGSIENKALKQKLNEADFYVQLSHSESLGMSIIEAQTYGLPAIVSDSDGLPEVVIHNKTGYCVKPYAIEKAADYIETLWNDSDLYRSFSSAAVKHSQVTFSIQNEVEKLSHLYQSLMSK
ncbi:glycosyltransferase family 4 protein [Winogradskyella eckloniae]|uniref:glycosyltransferase family 4 protein n=1 Tax=Winogradskyella eckloniae TaxID=1089306 RepID=UPI001564B655|nr:glycosyltransferase family 4 protein [Winogradskyella eckloniae]NRD20558.1 glycosyltransferase family 4 protein [Winogradskyella eckloniae]